MSSRGLPVRSLASAAAVATLLGLLAVSPAPAQAPTDCDSKKISAAFEPFLRTGKMPPDLRQWLLDAKAQTVEPYRAFDNVYYVGVCWVSAWLVKTSDGAVLLDTLHDPFGDLLISNIRKVGVDPADIKYVLMTHGHFDHVGGAYKLKPLTKARFVMTEKGWDEAIQAAQSSQGTPRQWTMIEKDLVVKDGDVISVGDTTFGVYETPGHTFGTASYSFPVRDGARYYQAFTVGGLGLNAIEGSRQVEAYIASVTRILQLAQRQTDPITVHLTTHPFSNGLTESAQKLTTRGPGDPHPLVDPAGFIGQLETLRKGAEERLVIERSAGR
jgi:metallo-beta-lactamase class B